MAFDFESLEPLILQILKAPGTDLATISAKRVRKQLQLIDPTLTPEFLKQHRDAVDVIIGRVFEQVQSTSGSQASDEEEPLDSSPRKRRQSSEEGYSVPKDEDTDVDESPPPSKKAKKAAKRELTDAELARQLSSEINGRTRRSNGKPKAASNGTPKKRKSRTKSAAMVDTDDDSDSIRPPKKRSGEGGTAKGGFAKPYLLSEPLAAVLGTESLSRPQVVKQLWAYIKSNELQNPDNKREIICDHSLRPVFNVDKIDMFRMNKVLGQHLHEME
ncbi:upstream activation factor subunit spp27 [Favolaschia claudopus]|uniref:Upstream activation factor subunit spp27 n=1 Tax=Favolaschia claudopus TaxID=2862362 RepID=A0AAW0DZ11_9AGAR